MRFIPVGARLFPDLRTQFSLGSTTAKPTRTVMAPSTTSTLHSGNAVDKGSDFLKSLVNAFRIYF